MFGGTSFSWAWDIAHAHVAHLSEDPFFMSVSREAKRKTWLLLGLVNPELCVSVGHL